MTRRGPTELAGNPSSAPRRLCCLCDALVSVKICPKDGTATLSLDAPSSDPDRLHPGRVIADRYRIDAAIGRGGFSRVFRAVHSGTGQTVALKVLGGGGHEDTAGLRRFFREARASAGLRHPNTVRVFDFGQEDDGIVFLAMELLTGQTLRGLQNARLDAGEAISEKEAIEIAIAVTQSLGEAHSMGLVHRDVGPNNIYLHEVSGSDRVVKLLDFGLVKDGGLRPLTLGMDVCGTASYMSPEHILGQRVTPRSDLYSLGITLWWMLAGSAPFAGGTHREVMHRHLQEPLPSLRTHARSKVSAELEAVIERAAAKDPEARFADAAEMKLALEGVLERVRERTQKIERAATEVAETAVRVIEVATQIDVEPTLLRTASASRVSSRAPARPPLPWMGISAGAVGIALVLFAAVSLWPVEPATVEATFAQETRSDMFQAVTISAPAEDAHAEPVNLERAAAHETDAHAEPPNLEAEPASEARSPSGDDPAPRVRSKKRKPAVIIDRRSRPQPEPAVEAPSILKEKI